MGATSRLLLAAHNVIGKFSPKSDRYRHPFIEPLECRRMLAVFNGTSGADTITLYMVSGVPHVKINSTIHQTTDTSIRVNALGGDDDIHMHDWAPGTIVDLGGGWNQVYYGGNSNILFGELPPATIIGTTGTYPPDDDEIYFDDTGGGTTARTYNFTPTSAMNQTFVNIDSINLKTRPSNAAFPNTINMTGSPTSFLTSMSGRATLNIGTSSAPVDMDDINVRITTNLIGDKNYYNEDVNNTNQPYIFERVSNVGTAQIQDFRKGSFRISHYENYDNNGTPVNMFVFGGSTVDQFDIAGLVPASNVVCYGGGGNDICRTTNGNWSTHNDDIDDVFRGNQFAFFGGTGLDYLDLNDINDQTNDGDTVYQLDTFRFLKNAVPFVYFDASTERIQVIGDQGPNDIHFTTNPNSQVTIGGAGGNDTLYAGNFGALSSHGASATISGGDGTDLLIITTANDNAITQYDFDNGNRFSWNVGATTRSMIYDGSLEQLRLTGNTNGTPYNVRRIPSTLALTIDANAGDDTFTVGGGDLDSNGFRLVTLSGGSGNDSITFDDSLDAPTPGETEAYTWTSIGLTKGPAVSIVAGSFELQTLKTGGVNASPSVSNIVNLNSSNAQISMVGSGNRPTTINVGQGNLNTISGNINITMPPGPGDILNINDQNNADSGVEYQLTNTSFTRSVGPVITHFMNFTGINQRNLNAGNGNNNIGVFGSAPGETTVYNGGGGNDTFFVGQGNLDNQLLGSIEIIGGPGIDTVRFNNSSDNSVETQTLLGNTFTDGVTHSWSGVEIVRILTGPGGGAVNITSATTETFIDGNSGADIVNIGNAGSLDTALLSSITFNGGAGNDLLLLDDRNDTGNDSYDVLAGQFRKFSTTQSPSVNFDNTVETLTLHANVGSNFIFVGSHINARVNLFAGPGNDRIDTNGSHDITVDTGSESPGGGSLGDELYVNFDGVAATVQVRSTDRIAKVDVRSGGKLQLLGGTLDVTSSLAFNFGGVIDLSGGAMVVRNAAAQSTQYRNWIRTGYNNGAWNGESFNGSINSSLPASTPTIDGVGFAPASGLFSSFPMTWSDVSIDANSMLLRHTLVGDADLNGPVNLNDFNRLASNFGQSGRLWHHADGNYDGTVNLTDFNLLAQNFGQSTGPGTSTARAPQPDVMKSLRERLVELA